MSTPANSGKDVIYIDVDDEITAIIDKVRSSNEKIVALVLPKRATVFQSVVNMKLLKRTADDAKKHVVLITAEAGLLPLAANIGMYVAKNLQTKPEVPEMLAGAHVHGGDLAEEMESLTMEDAPIAAAATAAALSARGGSAGALDSASGASSSSALDKHRAVGDLAKGAGVGSAVEEAIDFDNTPGTQASNPLLHAANTSYNAGKSSSKGIGKKLSIPNFNKFRMLAIFGGGGLVALIVLLFVCFSVLPSATVDIKTDSQSVGTNATFTLNTQASTADAQNNVVPAQAAESDKTLTQQVDATGQQNNGTKASGAITVTNCSGAALSLPAGTGFSANNQTFISQSAISLPDSNYTHTGSCKGDSKGSVNVVAQTAGAAYNASPQAYSASGLPSGATATGSQMSGGADSIVQIVQQSDIDSAKSKLGAQDTTAIKQELQTDLQGKGLHAVAATFNIGTPNVSTSANVGDQATSVTVTEKIAYTMLGVSDTQLKQIVKTNVDAQIDTSKQTILDYGLTSASFATQGAVTATSAQVTMQSTSVAGSDLNANTIKQQVAGKKSGDAEQLIKAYPGVTSVNVSYGPFWVSSVPKKTSKITVTIEKPQASNAKSR